MRPSAKHILLLGGAGLVGCNLACLLVSKGYRVTVVDRNVHNLRLLSDACPSITAVPMDIVDSDILPYVQDADVVVQLQAQIMSLTPDHFSRNNVASVERVLTACKNAKTRHLIHLSSSVVISASHDVYTETKRKGEQLVQHSGVPYTILRPPLMYGCFDAKHLGYLTRFLLKSPVFPLPGSGRYMRQPLYVMDLCRIILTLIRRPAKNKMYTIIGKERINFVDLMKTIAQVHHVRRLFLPLPLPVFTFLLRLYAVITRKPPFTADQLRALTAGDDFPVTSWEKEFGVTYTPFRQALQDMTSSQYASTSIRMRVPH